MPRRASTYSCVLAAVRIWIGAVVFVALAPPAAFGQSHFWTSATNGTWNTAARWTPNDVPDQAGDIVLIDATGAAYVVTYNFTTVIDQLTLNSADATMNMTGGALTLNTFNMQNGAYNMSLGMTLNVGNLNVSGGTATLAGGVLNGGTVNLTGGVYNMTAGTVNNATLLATAGLRYNTTTGNTIFNNVVLGDAVNADVLRIDNNVTSTFQGTTDFRAGFVPTLSGTRTINYATSKSLATDFIFTSGRLNSSVGGQTITIGAGRTISAANNNVNNELGGAGNWTNDGTIQLTGVASRLAVNNTGAFVNNGTVLAQNAGAGTGTITFSNLASFSNAGVLRATTGGQITMITSMTTAQLGEWDTTGGGVLLLSSGTLTNTGNILNITAARGQLNSNGNRTILGGTLAADAGLRLTGAGMLNNVTLGGANGNRDVLNLATGNSWTFQGTTDFAAGFTPTFTGGIVNYATTITTATDATLGSGTLNSSVAGQTATIGAGRTVSAAATASAIDGQFGGAGNWINNGTIQTTGNGARIDVLNTGSFVNNGTMLAQSSGATLGQLIIDTNAFQNNGTLRATTNARVDLTMATLTTAQLGSWDSTGGGTVRVNAPLNNAGDVLFATTARGALTFGSTAIVATGGTLASDIGVRFDGDATLVNVTLGGANGNKDVLRLDNGNAWFLQGTTDFQSGFTPIVGNGSVVRYTTSITLATDFILRPTGVLQAGAAAGVVVTLPTGRTITADNGNTNIAGSGSLVNFGTIRAVSSAGSFNLSVAPASFSNFGTLLAQGVGPGATGLTYNPNTLTNYTAATFTLTDGTYRALNFGAITASTGTPSFRNLAGNATVELGASSVFGAIEGDLTTIGLNAGFIVSGGKAYNVTNPTSAFTSDGLLRATGVGSAVTVADAIAFSNYNAGTQTLTGGTYEALNGGALNFGTRSTPIVQAGTTIRMSGATSGISIVEGGVLRQVFGTLSVGGGKDLAVAATGLAIESGGTLSGGGGAISGGLVTIKEGGKVSPGNSTGTITARNGIKIEGDYISEIDDNGDGNLIAGTDFDQIIVTGGIFSVGPNSHLVLSFGPSVNFDDPYWDEFRAWKIVDAPAGGGSIESIWNNSQIVVLNGPFTAAQFSLRISSNPGVFLDYTPVAEGSALWLASVAAAGAWLSRRRRKHAS